MKIKYLFIIAFLSFPLVNFAQVAVNTSGADASASAMLDITSNNKGILIPKMIISDDSSNTSPVNLPAEGLLIYNTGSPEVSEGFYYWSGLRWNLLTNDLTSLTNAQTSQLYEAAELFENNDFATPTVINMPSSSSYYGWVSASEGEIFGSTTTALSNSTADQVIVGEDGLYELEISVSFGGGQNVQVLGNAFLTPNGGSAAATRVQFVRKIGSTGDLGSASAHGLVRLNAGDALDIRFKSQSDGDHVDIYSLNFIVSKVGE